MRKMIFLGVGLVIFFTANVWAKEEGVDVGKSAKQVGNVVGGAMGQLGKAIAPGVGKVESSLDGAKRKDSKKSDKAGK